MLRRMGRVVLGVVVAGTLVAGVGVATAVAAPGGPRRGGDVAQGTELNELPVSDLSQAEIDGLLFMVEEEKLARDVYGTLYDVWGQATFERIAGSEQRHMDALKVLLERYDLTMPVDEDAVGEFANAELQGLYDSLVAEGRESLVSALRVGALIEEIDILDLEEAIAETDAADLVRVYENLLRGSRIHLRAFGAAVERETGEPYEPQRMDGEAYQAAIEGGTGYGGWGQRGNRDGQYDENGRAARGDWAPRGFGDRGARRSSRPSEGWGDGTCLE